MYDPKGDVNISFRFFFRFPDINLKLLNQEKKLLAYKV